MNRYYFTETMDNEFLIIDGEDGTVVETVYSYDDAINTTYFWNENPND